MGNQDFGRQYNRHTEQRWGQHRSGWVGDWAGGWGNWGGGDSGGGSWGGGPGRRRSGPPPWVGELFGLAQSAPSRGPRVRRGDVRAAILDMLSEEPMNGYQLITQIAERSGGVWRPSPGSVYPTISQLEDEGLVESDDDRGRRTLRLTEAGRRYVEENPGELASVWAPFGAARPGQGDPRTGQGGSPRGEYAALKPELGQMMSAVWQIVTQGSDQQRRDAIGILIETRRKLYNLLAEGDATEAYRSADEDHEGEEGEPDAGFGDGYGDEYGGADAADRP